MEAGQAQPVVRVAVADAHVVVLVDVDRLEQRLIAQPAVRVVSVGIDVGDGSRDDCPKYARASPLNLLRGFRAAAQSDVSPALKLATLKALRT